METSLQKLLSNVGINALNPMQEAAHKTILHREEVVLIAPTGSGKTIAYLLPLLQLLKTNINSVQCLVLVPSRELALQIEQVWKKLGTGFKANACYGGHSVETEIKNLSIPPALLIGTPGRIADHIKRRSFSLEEVSTLILDEFDKSLELGFQEEMGFIIQKLNRLKKKILVSATGNIQIPAFARVHSPVELNFSPKTSATSPALTMQLVVSEDKDKVDTLFQLLCSLDSESALIFCNHRDACERTAAYLSDKKMEVAFYHGGMDQDDRERSLIKFRNGSVNYLVTTDLAARGLDIPEMKHVIHFHLPPNRHEFVHRNGRTARMHASGTAYVILPAGEKQPGYINEPMPVLSFGKTNKLPIPPTFKTIYISGGKKNKLNKGDIVGAFLQKGKLGKDDLGIIEVKDFQTFVAVKAGKVPVLLGNLREEKIKGKKYKIEVAR